MIVEEEKKYLNEMFGAGQQSQRSVTGRFRS
jgi:hypothetical protein